MKKIQKSIAITVELWQQAMSKAKEMEVSLSSVISAYLKRWVKK